MLHTHHADETPGRKGATKASFKEHNPRLLVKHIYDKYPQAGDPEIRERVRAALETRAWSAFVTAFIDHTTDNCLEAIKKEDRPQAVSARRRPYSKKTTADRIAEQAGVAATAASMLSYAKNAWRLEQPAPNGKPLGDCTGLELSQFSGFYKELGRGVGPQQKLRDVKTGDDVAAVVTFVE